MDYNKILEYFLSTSTITIAIVYFAKIIFDKFADSKIEKYKNSLNIETEKFKSELNITSIEHQIKYTKLYEERGQIIKLIYNQLFDLERALLNLTTLFQGPNWTNDLIRDDLVLENISKLNELLERNRIFFSTKHCEKIEIIIEDSKQIAIEMYNAKINKKLNDENNKIGNYTSKEDLRSPSKKWSELDLKVKKEIKNARMDLAQDFRNLIGVS